MLHFLLGKLLVFLCHTVSIHRMKTIVWWPNHFHRLFYTTITYWLHHFSRHQQGSKWALFFVPGPAQSGRKNADARPAQTEIYKARPGPARPFIDARPARPIGPDYKSAFPLTISDRISVKIVRIIHLYLITSEGVQ